MTELLEEERHFMERRGFIGTALAGLPVTGAFAAPQKSEGR